MGLSRMKADLHDRLWNAQQRWFAMRDQGWTKHQVKIAGVKEVGDQNYRMRSLLFTGRTRMTYERALKGFLDFAHEKFGVLRLDDIDTKHGKAFLEDAIQRGLAGKTLHTLRSALAKGFALVGKTASGIALSRKFGEKIRALVADGVIAGPQRATPSRDVVERAIEILRAWDQRTRTRAYHLAARLQLETGARSVSVTERLTKESLKGAGELELVAKGGKSIISQIPADLYRALTDHFATIDGPLADRRGYQAAWRRAIRAVQGRVAGTHGLRRLSTQEFYGREYARCLATGASPTEARQVARQEAVQRLGHSRDRNDQANCYLGPAA